MFNRLLPLVRIGLIMLACTLWVLLACDTSQVDPQDPRLQPPTSNIGINIGDFLVQIGLYNYLSWTPIPWIVQPISPYIATGNTLEIKGWGPTNSDIQWLPGETPGQPTVRLSIENSDQNAPDVDVPIANDRSWKTTKTLPTGKGQLLITARVIAGGLESGPSNQIRVFYGGAKPQAPVFTEPKWEKDNNNHKQITTDLARVGPLKGKAEPNSRITLLLPNGKIEETDTTANGDWVFAGPYVLQIGENKFHVSMAGDESFDELFVIHTVPIRLNWPFWNDSKADETIGLISAWVADDWHTLNSGIGSTYLHDAIDIAGNNIPIHPVAQGAVLRVKTRWVITKDEEYEGDECFGFYVIIDHGTWASAYGHMSAQSKLIEGSIVQPSDIVGLVGTTGQVYAVNPDRTLKRNDKGEPVVNYVCSTGPHVHVTVRRWSSADPKTHTSANFWNSASVVNINPPQKYKTYFEGKNIYFNEFFGDDDYWQIDWAKANLWSDALPPKGYNETCPDNIFLSLPTNHGPSDFQVTSLGLRRNHCMTNGKPDYIKCPCTTQGKGN